MMRLALCNEVLGAMPLARQCALARSLDYDALEITPSTLADDPATSGASRAAEIRRTIEDAGLAVSGLHWLLVKPAGLSLTARDAAVRHRTLDIMKRLCELCARLGGAVLVHGSPAQRAIGEGDTLDIARARLVEALAAVAPIAGDNGVVYCLEPLSRRETPLVNTVAEAAAILRAIAHPALRTLIDCSAAGQTESEPVPALIDRWLPTGLVAHIQVNDPNRRAPGQGDMRFAPIAAALRRNGYAGTVAVEPFDYVPDGPGAAAFAAGYWRGVCEAAEAVRP
jgi:sugar phosphate isomerase/epimerase